MESYAIFNLAANTGHVLVSTSCQEPGCTVKASANLCLGSLTELRYSTYLISLSATRSVTTDGIPNP